MARCSLVFRRAIAVAVLLIAQPSAAQQQPEGETQASRDAAFAKMLSGATLDGRYTSTAPGAEPDMLSRDKYTLGEVRKLGPGLWLIQARIQYGEQDVVLPITVPVRWAGDTPVIVVDNLGIPPFGTVSARVMFFDGHYAGYWRHGRQGGHLFGVIRPAEKAPEEHLTEEAAARASRADSPTGEQKDQ